MKMDVMRRQGSRSDLTSATQRRRSETAAKVGEEFGMGKSQVKKYIRLTELIPELLQMVDEKLVSIVMAVDISYFDKEVQSWIYQYRKENGILRPEQIEALKEQKNLENLTQYMVVQIMNAALPEPKINGKVSLSERKLNKYFPSHMSSKERERIILDLMARWKDEQEGTADES